MEHILKEINEIENEEEELHQIKILNETLDEFSDKIKKDYNEHLKVLANMLNQKIKNNISYNKVVEDFVNKFVPENQRDDAKDEMNLILTGELLALIKGANQTKCSIM